MSTPDRPRIRRLPEALANKIAAGEVVERPASVLKELVENSLDAGASRIDVKVMGGGRDLVEVVDDGVGMDPGDALLCLERHATSKLPDEAALFAIRTLGFRGEALPSIAAVSRLTLLTRTADALEGTRVEIEGGRVVSQGAAGAPVGTSIRVADLFFNVPARRKFLRRPQTEMGHLSEALVRIALAYPKVGFTLEHEGRRLLSSPGSDDLRERIAAALGREVHPHLHPVDDGRGEIRVHGYVAAPAVTKTSTRGLHLFVNGRFVRDRQLHHAITRAYEGLVDRGRSPVVVLFVDLPPEEVDVNVHPQKHEVRFAEGRRVYEAVASAVGRTLAAAPWLGGERKRYALAREDEGEAPKDAYAEHRARVLAALDRYGRRPTSEQAPLPGGWGRTGAVPIRAEGPAVPSRPDGPSPLAALEALPPPDEGPSGYFGSLRVIGQLRASYILCEGEDGLVVIDQHAAHERLEFERLRALWAEQQVVSQPLLVPQVLELPLGQAQALEAHAERLAGLGFDLSSLGGGSVAVRAVPTALAHRDIVAVIDELVGDLTDVDSDAAFREAVDRLLATVACHSVVRAGDRLSLAECEALLARMDPIPFRANCPHGRPVAFALESRELERRFQRR